MYACNPPVVLTGREEPGMDRDRFEAYEAWLAAMPVREAERRAATIDAEIALLQREKELITALAERQRQQTSVASRLAAAPEPDAAAQAPRIVGLPKRKRRLSPERVRVV